MFTSVFVSGATGFIAQHIIKLLISKGYKVVGSVRSAAKGDHLQSLFGKEHFSYEVVSDLASPGAFDSALEKHPEVTVFLHTASPVSFTAEDVENELLLPAVEGTKNALKAVKAHGPQIKHVVVTSSVAASIDISRLEDPTCVLNEESWSPITWEQSKLNSQLGYFGSKKFAERAAWDFYEQEKPSYSLNVVNPSYVFGPQAFDSEVKDTLNFSSEILNSFLSLGPDSPVPEHKGAFIDVRDVAKAHVAAFEKGMSNQRLLLSHSAFDGQVILDILNDSFDSLKGKLPAGSPGFNTTESSTSVDNSKTRKALGFEFYDLETSVVDSVAQILSAKKAAK